MIVFLIPSLLLNINIFAKNKLLKLLVLAKEIDITKFSASYKEIHLRSRQLCGQGLRLDRASVGTRKKGSAIPPTAFSIAFSLRSDAVVTGSGLLKVSCKYRSIKKGKGRKVLNLS